MRDFAIQSIHGPQRHTCGEFTPFSAWGVSIIRRWVFQWEHSTEEGMQVHRRVESGHKHNINVPALCFSKNILIFNRIHRKWLRLLHYLHFPTPPSHSPPPTIRFTWCLTRATAKYTALVLMSSPHSVYILAHTSNGLQSGFGESRHLFTPSRMIWMDVAQRNDRQLSIGGDIFEWSFCLAAPA